MNRSDGNELIGVRTWTTLFFLAGIDGFQLLEPLRELGSRPFFLMYIGFVLIMLIRGQIAFHVIRMLGVIGFSVVALFGFLFFGLELHPFADKTPITQFVAQGALFIVGFSSLFLRLRGTVSESTLIRSAAYALAAHVGFMLIDLFAIATNIGRPFEGSFLAEGNRPFPSGLFSEPSYVGAYVGMLLPFCLSRVRASWVIVCSLVVGGLFFFGDVRTFFVVYAAGLLTMMLVRGGLNWRVLIAVPIALGVLIIIGSLLKVISVEDSLSSAYRFGNTISFLDHALDHEWLLGVGFGAAHFLYPMLDHPGFMYLSKEFTQMIQGDGFRVPVFNLWVRLFVEVGIIPTLLLLVWIFRVFRSGPVLPAQKILFASCLAFTLSNDSYIYGLFTLALMLLFSITCIPSRALPRKPASCPDSPQPSASEQLATQCVSSNMIFSNPSRSDSAARPKVLVLLATRNGGAWVEQQLSSVLDQVGICVEIYVRDDGSSDDTRAIVANFRQPNAPVFLREDHQALGSAGKNFFELILHADVDRYDFVAFCDQDDLWFLDKMQRAIAFLRTSGADGYSSGVEAFWPDGRKKQLVQNRNPRLADHLFEGAGQGCTFVMTAQFFAEVQTTLSHHSEYLGNLHYHDWTIYALARTLGKTWFIDPVATMSYRQHSSNDTGARGSLSGLHRRLSLIRNGWYRQQVDNVVDLILAVRPREPVAATWQALSLRRNGGLRARIRRLHFVVSNGRRRLSDRLVLMLAVILGYL